MQSKIDCFTHVSFTRISGFTYIPFLSFVKLSPFWLKPEWWSSLIKLATLEERFGTSCSGQLEHAQTSSGSAAIVTEPLTESCSLVPAVDAEPLSPGLAAKCKQFGISIDALANLQIC